MRRVDREMPKDFAYEVIDRSSWATLSLIDPDGNPYGVPISMIREGDALYFHCAKEGLKTASIRQNPKVCVSFVGDTKALASHFTMEYESAIICGTASEITDSEAKTLILRTLSERFASENMARFDTALKESLSHTAIWQIDIQTVSGKRQKYDASGREMKFGRMS